MNRSTDPRQTATALDRPSETSSSEEQRFSVEIINDGLIGEHTRDLTRVAAIDEFTNGTDMAAHMRILEPLRGWLEINGALTPGSGILVRTLSDRLRPEDILEERALPGTVVDRRELVTVLREPHDPTGM